MRLIFKNERTEQTSFLIFAQRDISSSPAEGSPDQTSRSIISTTSLHLLPGFHVSSVYQVFFLGSSLFAKSGKTHLGSGFALRCFQRFSFLDVAIQLWGGPPNWHTSGPAISVLSY
jgi:hypothetical protein